jgi:hypothetical protein
VHGERAEHFLRVLRARPEPLVREVFPDEFRIACVLFLLRHPR